MDNKARSITLGAVAGFASLALCLAALTGCDSNDAPSSAQDAGERLDDTYRDAADSIDDAFDDMNDGFDDPQP
ncbi:MAG: hypothetical protein LAT64_03110 [Phycisphaerales bacterium]|nr:YtxH domain-containing protein [Planctomycetota bacterium]MCH8507746.1 hypothetical protein [Phycisphaerales bacterium]